VVTVFYEEMAPAEFRARLAAAPIAYLPLGTLEWHGEHLPLGADAIQATGLFARVAGEVGGIVLPALHLGPDRRTIAAGVELIGMDSDDTTVPNRPLEGSAYWVDDAMFDAILDATVRNLARAGFRIVVAHGHGPSTRAFRAASPRLEARHGVRCRGPLAAGTGPGFMTDHAAANETSITLALRPDLVHMDRLPTDPEVVLTGVGGPDPRLHASVAHGEAALAAAAQDLVRRLREDLAAPP